MSKILRTFQAGIWAVAIAATLSSCIDEDMSDCGKDYQINYTLRLNTQVNATIDQELNQNEEQEIASRLKSALGTVFTDHAKDNDLSFFVGDELSHHEANPMDASSVSYTIFLPRNNYRNLALANTSAESAISLIGQDKATTLAMTQEKTDTIDSHKTGLFSARLNIAEDDFNSNLQTTLYMQNAAAAVVIDKNNVAYEDIRGCVKGMANTFAINDSTYSYDYGTIVRANKVASTSQHEALYAVSFPSKDAATTSKVTTSKATTKATSDESQDDIWQFHIYVKIDGKTTQNILSFHEPLKAGTLKIAKVTLQPNGSFTSDNPSVGVSVKLDWKPGGSHDIDI